MVKDYAFVERCSIQGQASVRFQFIISVEQCKPDCVCCGQEFGVTSICALSHSSASIA